jgi:hypothetical protein
MSGAGKVFQIEVTVALGFIRRFTARKGWNGRQAVVAYFGGRSSNSPEKTEERHKDIRIAEKLHMSLLQYHAQLLKSKRPCGV